MARAVEVMRTEGIDSDWERYLSGKSSTIFSTKRSGYLERVCSAAVARCAEILHAIVGVERNAPLEKTLTQPQKQGWRIYGAELSDEHVGVLRAAADTGETIKFRGQQHTVARCQGGWVTATGEQNTHAGNEVFDLLKPAKR